MGEVIIDVMISVQSGKIRLVVVTEVENRIVREVRVG